MWSSGSGAVQVVLIAVFPPVPLTDRSGRNVIAARFVPCTVSVASAPDTAGLTPPRRGVDPASNDLSSTVTSSARAE